MIIYHHLLIYCRFIYECVSFLLKFFFAFFHFKLKQTIGNFNGFELINAFKKILTKHLLPTVHSFNFILELQRISCVETEVEAPPGCAALSFSQLG